MLLLYIVPPLDVEPSLILVTWVSIMRYSESVVVHSSSSVEPNWYSGRLDAETPADHGPGDTHAVVFSFPCASACWADVASTTKRHNKYIIVSLSHNSDTVYTVEVRTGRLPVRFWKCRCVKDATSLSRSGTPARNVDSVEGEWFHKLARL